MPGPCLGNPVLRWPLSTTCCRPGWTHIAWPPAAGAAQLHRAAALGQRLPESLRTAPHRSPRSAISIARDRRRDPRRATGRGRAARGPRTRRGGRRPGADGQGALPARVHRRPHRDVRSTRPASSPPPSSCSSMPSRTNGSASCSTAATCACCAANCGVARRQFVRAIEYARDGRRPDRGVHAHCTTSATPSSSPAELPDAIRAMDEAGELSVEISRGVWLLDRARVLGEAGLVQAADARSPRRGDLQPGPAGPGSRRDRTRAGPLRADRRAGAVVARRFAMRARDRFRRRGSDRWRRDAELVLLQGDLAAGRPGRRLTGPALRLRHEFELEVPGCRPRPPRSSRPRRTCPRARSSRPRARCAKSAASTRRDPITTRLHAGYVRARLDLATGRRAAAAGGPGARCRPGGLPGQLRQHRSRHRGRGARPAAGRSRPVRRARIGTGRARARVGRAGPGGGEPAAGGASARRPGGRAAARRAAPDGRGVAPGRAAASARRRARSSGATNSRPGSLPVAGAAPAAVSCAMWSRSTRSRAVLGDSTLVSYSRADDVLHAVVVDAERAAAGRPRRCRCRRRAGAPGACRPRRARPTPAARAVAGGRLGVVRPVARTPGRGAAGPARCHADVWSSSRPACSASCPGGCSASLRGVPVVVTPSVTAWHGAATADPSRSREVVAIAGPGVDRGTDEVASVCARLGAARPRGHGADATAAAFTAAMSQARLAQSRRMECTRPRTRCSRPSGSPTARCSRTNSTRAPARPSTWCSRRASWAWPQCVPATRRSG